MSLKRVFEAFVDLVEEKEFIETVFKYAAFCGICSVLWRIAPSYNLFVFQIAIMVVALFLTVFSSIYAAVHIGRVIVARVSDRVMLDARLDPRSKVVNCVVYVVCIIITSVMVFTMYSVSLLNALTSK